MNRDLDAENAFEDAGVSYSGEGAGREDIWDAFGNIKEESESVNLAGKGLPDGITQEEYDEIMEDVRYDLELVYDRKVLKCKVL